jgi:hypothetical protein
MSLPLVLPSEVGKTGLAGYPIQASQETPQGWARPVRSRGGALFYGLSCVPVQVSGDFEDDAGLGTASSRHWSRKDEDEHSWHLVFIHGPFPTSKPGSPSFFSSPSHASQLLFLFAILSQSAGLLSLSFKQLSLSLFQYTPYTPSIFLIFL